MKQNKLLMIGGVIIIVLVIGGIIFVSASGKKKSSSDQTQNVLPSEEAIPTVDASVKVSLTPTAGNKEVVLKIENIPHGTTAIEYEMSYLSKGTLPKGVIGTINLDNAQPSLSRTITLGTCSSGTCVYDEGVTSVTVSLKFDSPSGSKAFNKDFPLTQGQ